MLSIVPRLRFLAVVLTLALLIPGLTTGRAAKTGEKILRVQHAFYPDVVDPQKSSFTNEIDVMALVYEGLTRLDTNQETVPAAAESWEYNEDATQITFHLRPGLTYSDGSPLTAENFRYAVERTCDPVTAGEYQSILFAIVGCTELARLGVDAEGNTREYTPAEYEAAKAALGDSTVDPAARLRYYKQASQILIDDVPGPFLFNPAGLALIKPSVTGITPTASEAEWPGSLSSLMTIDKSG